MYLYYSVQFSKTIFFLTTSVVTSCCLLSFLTAYSVYHRFNSLSITFSKTFQTSFSVFFLVLNCYFCISQRILILSLTLNFVNSLYKNFLNLMFRCYLFLAVNHYVSQRRCLSYHLYYPIII